MILLQSDQNSYLTKDMFSSSKDMSASKENSQKGAALYNDFQKLLSFTAPV